MFISNRCRNSNEQSVMIIAPSLNHVTVTETKIYISVQVYLGPKKAIPLRGSEKGWEKTDMPNKSY